MYGLKNCQSTPKIWKATRPFTIGARVPCSRSSLGRVEPQLLLEGARLHDLRIDRRDLEAALLLDDLAALVVDRDVRVVRDVQRQVAGIPRLAEHVRLLVLQIQDRAVVGRLRD